MLCTVTWYIARKNNYPRMPKASWGECLRAFRESIWGLMLVVIIIGGIYSGIFTATEAAAMSAVYAFFIAVYVYKESSSRTCRGCCCLGEHERDAALHHHQRGAVLVRAGQREHPERARRLDLRTISARSASCCWSTCCC